MSNYIVVIKHQGMPHYTIFSKNEYRKIKNLLEKISEKTKAEQLEIYNLLKETYGFYVSDFSRVRPYTSITLEQDLGKGLIEIYQFSPEYEYYTGWPKEIYERLNRTIGQYQRHYKNVKVGITNDPKRRFYEHINRDPEMHWERMIVKYMTSSRKNANEVEKWFINNRLDLTNSWTGDSRMSESGPFYTYILLGNSKI